MEPFGVHASHSQAQDFKRRKDGNYFIISQSRTGFKGACGKVRGAGKKIQSRSAKICKQERKG